MKKRLVGFALMIILASPVFADFSFSGLIGSGITILNGTSRSGDSFFAGGSLWGRLQVDAQNGNGTLGGVLRLKAVLDLITSQDELNKWGTFNPYAWIWWQPLEQLKIQVGFIDEFYTSDIVAWDFHGNDADDYVAAAGGNHSDDILYKATGFYDGTWWTGAMVSIKPIPGLAINAAVPYQLGNIIDSGTLERTKAHDVYFNILGQITYEIPDIGRIAVTYEGKGDSKLEVLSASANGEEMPLDALIVNTNASTIYTSFLLKALEDSGVGVNLGFAYTLPSKSGNVTYYTPMAAGLGVSFAMKAFEVKLRVAATFFGKLDNGFASYEEPFKLGVGIVPTYDFGFCKVHFNAGLVYTAKDSFDDGFGVIVEPNPFVAWHVNPFVTKSIGPSILFAGLQLESSFVGNSVRWAIPIGAQLEF